MAATMTSRERVARMFEHKEADRIPIWENPWATTLDRWKKQGLKSDDWAEEFGLDKTLGIWCNNSPNYPVKILEEGEDYVIQTTEWGVTLKQFKEKGSTPQFLDFTVTDLEKWHDARRRMVYDPSRINWDYLNSPVWKDRDKYWTNASLWFGFDVTHSWMVGTERFLYALVDDPDWVKDIYDTQLSLGLIMLEKVLEAGHDFDAVTWPDDMGYKGTQFFSLDVYRELSKPFHKKACDWAHERGKKVILHSCGNILPFVPELIEVGVDALNPLEVKAGMDPYFLKDTYGDKLVLWGGCSALNWREEGKVLEDIETLIPYMKKNGGYIFATDHSVPDNVDMAGFRAVMERVKELGRY